MTIRDRLDVPDEYFIWLINYTFDSNFQFCDKEVLGLSPFLQKEIGGHWHTLLKELHNTPFLYADELDGNRCKDGQELRKIFTMDTGSDGRFLLPLRCTCLEVLIGLGMRLEGLVENITVSEFVVQLLDNLGLLDLDDVNFYENEGRKRVEITMQYAMFNKVPTDGYGELFPLNGEYTMRKNNNIWYRMNAYMLENYGYDDD